MHPDAVCTSLERASVGNSQETWFVEASWPGGSRSLVLRRSASDGTLTWTSRTVEYEALRVVGAAGLPVAPVVWLDGSGGPLERPYFVMERVAGAPPRDAAVSRELGELLARLHEVPVGAARAARTGGDAAHRPADDPLAALPSGGAAGELARWEERYRDTRLAAMPLAGALFAWLEAHLPEEVPPALLWGDAGPHNLLVADGRITALLDWELAHLGHPLDDLGAAQWACFNVLDPDEILAGYEAQAGPVDRDALRWFRCLACLSRSVMLLASNRAFAEGAVHRPSLAALGLDLVARNLSRAAREARWEEAAVGDPRARWAGEARGAGEVGAAHGAADAPIAARPDARELAVGLAGFLAADLLPATQDRALRRELKNAVALLETIALQTHVEHVDQSALEDEARALELQRAPEREAMRARLLAEHAASDTLLAPLRRLLGPRQGASDDRSQPTSSERKDGSRPAPKS